MKSSLLVVVLGGICTCSFLRRNALSLFFFSPIGLWFKMQTGQQVAITVACSCEMMLVPVRSVFFFVMFVLMFNNYVHGDYPYMPHSKWANISETGPQSVSSTGDFRSITMPNLKIVQRGCEFSLWNKVISIFFDLMQVIHC